MGRKRKALPASVNQARRRIDRWRETRKQRSPMPEHLWLAAVALAEEHNVHLVARGLRVSYESLKYRVAAAADKRRSNRRVPAGFVELSPVSATAFQTVTAASVELVHPGGAKLTINLPADHDLDVTSLTETFLSHGT